MTVVNIVGARPQFIKAGPVSKALRQANIDELLVHTGQHYDPIMSQRVMEDIGLREPDINLGVGSGSHAVQTGRMIEGVEGLLRGIEAAAVIVYGDTNSTIASALAATKLHIPTAHVEAGLRSRNRRMPEEINRVVTDHVSEYLFAPTQTAMDNLTAEGLEGRSVLTGDVMFDAIRAVDIDHVPTAQWATGAFYLATIHRAENTDDPDLLGAIVESMSGLNDPVHLLAHPRLASRLAEFGIGSSGSLQIHEPLAYAEMIATLQRSSGLFTDSGGLQKEAFMLRVPCVTLRTETEWPETLEGGWNIVVAPGSALGEVMQRPISENQTKPFGDGRAAVRIVEHLSLALSEL